MKYLLTLFACIGITFFLSAQSFYTDFQDGTLEGWTNVSGDTQGLTVEPSGNVNIIQKVADGSSTAQGRMSIVNQDTGYWAGNYFYSVIGEQTLHTVDDIFIKNPNDFDLKIRYGFKGANGMKVVTTVPIVVPANSDWENYATTYYIDFGALSISNISVLNDTSGMTWTEVMQQIHELFENVEEFKIFHSEAVAYEGEQMEGVLQIESIISYELLNTPEFENDFKLYPNPVKDEIQVFSSGFVKSYMLYNTLGATIKEGIFNARQGSLDLSMLHPGVYLLELTFEDGTKTSKKLVKK